MDIKLQNKNCKEVPLSKIDSYCLTEYRHGFKTILFKLCDDSIVEWIVDDPEYTLNKIDMLVEYYFSNSMLTEAQRYFNVGEI